MKVRASDIAATLAPTIKRGAPADVIDAINTLAAALADGTTPSAAALRWPEPRVRTLVLELFASRDASALRGASDLALLAVMRAVCDAIEAVEAMHDRLRAGHKEALAHGHAIADGIDAAGVDAIWTPLALASLRAALAPVLAARAIEPAGRAAPRPGDATPWTLDRDAPALLAAQELWRQASASVTTHAMREKLTRAAAARAQPAGVMAIDANASPRSARIRARAAHVRRAYARTSVTPLVELPFRVGPLWIVLDRPRQPDPDEHAQWRTAVLLVASAGLASGRDVALVLPEGASDSVAPAPQSSHASEPVFDVASDGTFAPLLSLLDRQVVRRPSEAMAWVREHVRGPLDLETDVAIVSSSGGEQFLSESTTRERVELSAAQRAAGVRLHLVRPGDSVDFPHPSAFDAFHFLSVASIEA